MVVTNYSERQHGDPDVEVQFDHEGQIVTGFIDARRQNDGVWEAWVWFSYDENGWRATRKNWVRMDQLTVLTIDVPADQVTPSGSAQTRPARAPRLLTGLPETCESAHEHGVVAERGPGVQERVDLDLIARVGPKKSL